MKTFKLNGYHKTCRDLLRLLASDSRLSSAELRILLFALTLEREPGDSVELGRLTTSKAIGSCSRTCERARQALVDYGYLVDSGKGSRGARVFRIASAGMLTTGQTTDGDFTAGAATDRSAGEMTGSAGEVHINGNKKHNSIAENAIKTSCSVKDSVALTADGFVIPEPVKQAWTTAYPGIDIIREIGKAFAWCVSNPSRAPKKDYGRFLNSWLSRIKPPEKPSVSYSYEASPADIALMRQFEREIEAGKAGNA